MSGHTRTPSVQSVWSQSTSAAATTAGARGSNSLSECVYAGRDPWTHGWRQPTSRDIPQVTLPRVAAVNENALDQYVNDVQGCEIPREGNTHQDLQSLKTVPLMFFDEHFHLDNPRVFDAVIEDSQAATFDSAILQEKLSWYIDTVELHLIDRISNASGTFFSATAQFNDIQARSNELSSGLIGLKQTLKIISECSTQKACLSVELSRKLADVRRSELAVRQLGLALQKLDELDHISESGDMSCFLDHLDAVEKLVAGEENQWLTGQALVDLSGVNVLRSKLHALEDAKLKVGGFYVEELKSCLIGDLRSHVRKVPVLETLTRLGRIFAGQLPSSNTSVGILYSIVDESVRDTVRNILLGSARAHTTELAVAEYRDAVTREIKTLIRDNLPSRSNGEKPESSQSSQASDRAASAAALAIRLRDLPSDDAEEMVKTIFASLSEALRRLATHQKLLLDLTSSMGAPPVDLGDLLVSVITSSDTRVLKILKVRKDQTARLSLTKFVRFYALTSMFMAECEAICGVQTIELGTFLVAQTKLFFFTKYSNDEEMLQRSLNSDVWKKEEVPRSFQLLVDEIQEAATLDPASWLSILKTSVLPLEAPFPTENKASPLNLFIGNESYFLSKSAFFLLGLCHDYLRLICVFPHYSQDLTHNLLELLRLYNMRTSQLILGAGATKTAGLKHIYVKHMAMAYESLRAVAGIIPAMQRVVDRHCPTGISREFDGLLNSYGDHQHEIHLKFVNLMTDKSSYYCRAIANVDWAVKPDPVNKYMLDLIKDTTSIARVLEDILPSSESLAVLSEIFDVYKPRLLEAYFAVRLETYEEKENLMKDISEFRDRLGSISGIGNVAEVLYQTVDSFSAPELSYDRVPAPAEPKKVHMAAVETLNTDVAFSPNSLETVGEPTSIGNTNSGNGSDSHEALGASDLLLDTEKTRHSDPVSGIDAQPANNEKLAVNSIASRETSPGLETTISNIGVTVGEEKSAFHEGSHHKEDDSSALGPQLEHSANMASEGDARTIEPGADSVVLQDPSVADEGSSSSAEKVSSSHENNRTITEEQRPPVPAGGEALTEETPFNEHVGGSPEHPEFLSGQTTSEEPVSKDTVPPTSFSPSHAAVNNKRKKKNKKKRK